MDGIDLEITIKLVIAAILGGMIGLQREKKDRPAGFRTHILVCIGATLFTVISYYPFDQIPYADPTRIISQIVVGIGFLGAGTIIRQGNIVFGLTTAASLWTVAGIGAAVGVGMYIPATIVTVFVLLVLTSFKKLEGRHGAPSHLLQNYQLRIIAEGDFYTRFVQRLNELNINAIQLNLTKIDETKVTVTARLEGPAFFSSENLSSQLVSIPGIKEIEFTEISG